MSSGSPTCPDGSRAYDLNMSDGSRHAAIGIAVSRRCDLLVAVAHGRGDAPESSARRWTFWRPRNDALDDGGDGRAVSCFLHLLPACGERSRAKRAG